MLSPRDTATTARFADALRSGAEDLRVYEGLPHQSWEAELLEQELSTKRTIELGGYPFYDALLELGSSDAAQLLDVLSVQGTYGPLAGAKRCGGFHPDYAVTCRFGATVWTCLICFGCAEVKVFTSGEQSVNDLNEASFERLGRILKPYRRNRPVSE